MESFATYKGFQNSLDRIKSDQVYIEDKQQIYVRNPETNEWNPAEINSNVKMSLFEINQQLISQFNDFTDEDWKDAVERINNWYNEVKSNYYMMLCKEISYYTVFINGDYSQSSLGEMICECLACVGNVLTIDYSNKNCLDIWIRIDDETQCLHLFDYTQGIVDFRG